RVRAARIVAPPTIVLRDILTLPRSHVSGYIVASASQCFSGPGRRKNCDPRHGAAGGVASYRLISEDWPGPETTGTGVFGRGLQSGLTNHTDPAGGAWVPREATMVGKTTLSAAFP